MYFMCQLDLKCISVLANAEGNLNGEDINQNVSLDLAEKVDAKNSTLSVFSHLGKIPK